jgi:dTDP-glucose pyrophosphorylase
MRVVILAGGLGTRHAEETEVDTLRMLRRLRDSGEPPWKTW